MKRKGIAKHNNLKQYFDEIKVEDLLCFEEELDLSKRIEAGDKVAMSHLIKANLRLVVTIAKKYITNEWELSDLIQEGNIGLMKACEKYDYRRNVRFSTYASWWIKQSILRSINNKRRTIRLPHRKEEKLRKINQTINVMYQELKRTPNVKELSEKLGFNEIDIINLLNLNEGLTSIDSEINDDGNTFVNLINDVKFSPEILFEKKDLQEITEEIIDKLKAKEKEIIKQRFALDGNDKETLKKIARNLDISPETVRQIEIRALKKIKDNHSYLKEYLYN